MIELSVARQNGTVSSTVAALRKKLPPGSSGKRSRASTVESWLATTTDHHSGNMLPRTTAASRP